MFRHFPGLSLTMDDLRAKYAGQTGIWQAFAAPTRDELRRQAALGYYQGVFEDVLRTVLLEHRRAFLDGTMCGEIIPIAPLAVTPPAAAPQTSVLSLLERALAALDSVPTDVRSPSALQAIDAARSKAADIRATLEAMGSAILAEVEVLRACGDVPPPILTTLLSHPSPQVRAWAEAVLDARAVAGARSIRTP